MIPSADLESIALALGNACASEPSLAASLVLPDGTSRPVSHSIQRGGPGSAGRVLVLRGLGLNRTTAGSARLCISSQRPACRTTVGLCQPPTGSAPGTCRAELRDSAGGCCSESAVEAGARRAVELSTAAVSPGHLPAARSLLQSLQPGGLEVCLEATLLDTTAIGAVQGGTSLPARYAFSAATCELAQAMIARELNSAAADRGTQLTEPFAASQCSSSLVKPRRPAPRPSPKPPPPLPPRVPPPRRPPPAPITCQLCLSLQRSDGSAAGRCTDLKDAAGSQVRLAAISFNIVTCGGLAPPVAVPPLSRPPPRPPVVSPNSSAASFPPDPACRAPSTGCTFVVRPIVVVKSITIANATFANSVCFRVQLAPGASASAPPMLTSAAMYVNSTRQADVVNLLTQNLFTVFAPAYSLLYPASNPAAWQGLGTALTLRLPGLGWSAAAVGLSGRELCVQLRPGVALRDVCRSGGAQQPSCTVALYGNSTSGGSGATSCCVGTVVL
ncbi:hypothetical protein HYH03_011818 [Edaphochlamys debaryana]|uniref:Pherophorin domain-containing protein n=1 Tax=Edaphochlamys debaryana TaxID=47281 RepID=A0A835XWM4_9CHLO|nr:hypothetical protein HYH03_011818 [Edaphochlamys debaryana]|eukprot:KAG2489711.1 hypothetical protein HYH03_011818 [Edaphochlamys debaryana]